MKKNMLFLIQMLIISVLLFLIQVTGIVTHIVVSVIGLAALIVSALKTKKDWNHPILEILERVFYAVALITGGLLMKVHGIAIIPILHKVSAVLFVVLLITNELRKKQS